MIDFVFYFNVIAAWKVVKTWLSPEAQKKLKFVNKSDIQQYIANENLPEHMGGTVSHTWLASCIQVILNNNSVLINCTVD